LRADIDRQGRVQLRQPPSRLILAIYEAPSGKIDSIGWQVDGKEKGQFAPDPGDPNQWLADVSPLPWKRGDHRVRVIPRTAEPMVQEFVRELLVNYELPRPTIKTPAPLPRVVDKAEYRLQAEVLPGEGQATEIRLVHRHNNKDLLTDKAMETKAA